MSNLTLSLTANISDAQTKLAVLRSALTDVNATVRQSSAAYVEADNAARATLLPGLQALTAEQKNLQAGVAAATKAVQTHGEAHKGLFAQLQQNRAAFQEVEHSIRASMDALAAGASPMKVASQELPRIIQAFTELNGVSLATVLAMAGVAAGVIAVGGGLAALVIHAENVDEMFGKMQAAFEATGRGTEFTRAGAIVLIDALRSLHGVSTQNAEDMVQDFARIRTIGIGSFLDLGTAVAGYARVTGTEIKPAQEALTRALEGGYESVRKLDEQWQIFTPEQAEAARKFDENGKKADFMGVAIDALKTKFGNLIDSGLTPTQKATNDLGVAWDHLMHTFGQSNPITEARDALANLFEGMARFSDPKGLATLKADLADLQAERDKAAKSGGFWGDGDTGALDKDIAKLKEEIALKDQSAQASLPTGAAVPDEDQERLKSALDDAHKRNDVAAEREKIENAITKDVAAQATALAAGDAAAAAALAHDIAALNIKKESLKDAGGQTIVQQLQIELDQRIAKEQAFGAQAKALELQFWQDKKAIIKTGADQENGEIEAGSRAAYQIEQKVFTLRQTVHAEEVAATKKEIAEKKQATEQWWRDYSTGMEQAIKQSAGDYGQMKALARDWADTGKILFGDHVAQYKSASDAILKIDAEEKAQLRKNAEKQAAFEAEQARHAQAMAQINAKPDAGEFKVNAFDLVFSDGATKLQEQIQEQSDALTTGLNAELKDLQAEMESATTAGDTNRYQAALDKQVEATARTTQEITALQARASAATEAAWDKALAPIDRAFSSSVQGILEGTQTTAQAMNKLAESIVMSFVDTAEKDVTHWIAHELAKTTATTSGEATRTAVETAGSTRAAAVDAATGAKYVATEGTKTAATASGAATRNAAEASESGSFLGRLGSMVAGWLGLETDKTAETVAGTSTRDAAELASALSGRAIAVMNGMALIEIDAAVAAAGAMAATAAIPFVGPALAPEVAAATYGETMGWAAGMGGGIAGFAVGTAAVPFDQLALIHEGEIIVPAAQSAEIRAGNAILGGMIPSVPQIGNAAPSLSSAPSAGASTTTTSGGDTYHLTIQAIDIQSGAQFIQQHARTIVTALRGQVRNGTPLPGMR